MALLKMKLKERSFSFGLLRLSPSQPVAINAFVLQPVLNMFVRSSSRLRMVVFSQRYFALIHLQSQQPTQLPASLSKADFCVFDSFVYCSFMNYMRKLYRHNSDCEVTV